MKRQKERLYRVIVAGATPEGIAATNKLGELGIPVTLIDADHSLALSSGDIHWTEVAAVSYIQGFEQFFSPVFPFLARNIIKHHGHFHVLQYGYASDKVESLEDESQLHSSQPCQLVIGGLVDILAQEQEPAFRGAIQATDDIHKG